MQIIFGESVQDLPDQYTVLELDTFRLPPNGLAVKSYCVVDKIPLQEFATMEAFKQLHQDLLENYRQQKWDYCNRAIEQLLGKWAGELDSFYTNLSQRIQQFSANPPGTDWDGIIDKTSAKRSQSAT